MLTTAGFVSVRRRSRKEVSGVGPVMVMRSAKAIFCEGWRSGLSDGLWWYFGTYVYSVK